MQNDRQIITTTSRGHGFEPGDVVHFTPHRGSRWKTVRRLLTRPRLQVVDVGEDGCSFAIVERRMTWSEWRAEWVALVKG